MSKEKLSHRLWSCFVTSPLTKLLMTIARRGPSKLAESGKLVQEEDSLANGPVVTMGKNPNDALPCLTDYRLISKHSKVNFDILKDFKT